MYWKSPAMFTRFFVFMLPLAGLVGTPRPADAGYLPLWVLQKRAEMVLQGTDRGIQEIRTADPTKGVALAIVVREVLYKRPGLEAPQVAPGDSLLVIARGSFSEETNGPCLLFLMPQQRHRSARQGPPIFEGEVLPCARFVPFFTRKPASCRAVREIGADFCACAREAVLLYPDLVAARDRGEEDAFLRGALTDENPIVVASAMARLRLKGTPQAMEWLRVLVDHPEDQVRRDLAESIPYLAGEAAGQVGVRLLDDSDAAVQLLAAWGLGRIRYEAACPALASVLADPGRARDVRAICLSSLEEMNSPLLLPALERAVAAEDDTVAGRGFRTHLDRLRRAGGQR